MKNVDAFRTSCKKCQTLGITLEELNDAKRYMPFTFNDYVHMYPIWR